MQILTIVLTAFLTALVLVSAPSTRAFAVVTPREYRAVGVFAASGAAVPLRAIATDENGRRRSLRSLIARPTVLLFADYTCRTLCGPIVAFVAAALQQSRLAPGVDFDLLVIGLDPKDGPGAAARLRLAQLGDDAAINSATHFVTADQTTIAALTKALGYRYRYDAESDQYVHPAAAYVLRADGAVSRVLTSIGLSGEAMRLALVEAGDGRIGTWNDRVRLLCSGFDPVHGRYNLIVSRLLAGMGALTIVMVGGGIGALMLLERRRSA